MNRCPWANLDKLNQIYHDTLWGKPVYDSKALFKMLMLESQQSGLSWSLILKKLQTLELAYDNFDPDILIHYHDDKINDLMLDEGIIRHRLKILAMIHNAKMYFKIEEKYQSFSNYIWSFVNHTPIINHYHSMDEIPPHTDLSDLISKSLKKEGFKFVGTTTVYSFMQAVGIVNDHLDWCEYK